MSTTCHSLGVRREVLRPRYEDQDSAMYCVQGAQGNSSDLRTSGLNVPLHDCSVYCEREHRPSHRLGYTSWTSQRESSRPRSVSTARRSGSSLELVHIAKQRSKGHKAKAYDESDRLERSWGETPRHLLSITPEPLETPRLPSSQRIRERMVSFGDDVYLDAALPSRFVSTAGHQRDTPRRQSEDKLIRAPGNGEVAGEFQASGEYRKVLPKRPRASERQRVYVPAAPVIPRLPTPDLDSASDYELGLAKYDFCACCSSDERDEEDGGRWERGKAKMDKQVDHARAYISRVTMSERLIAEA
ncbi:hypothetical protein FHL15_007619 [Xylaria flabelliformis]|uniref:Uncharacterized protein n=1 Tax=Xylaria flabelliformis TaxID=2512241 RepID=A0A553HTV6_9PEZI|nr:hypothetical protein FHL15_007619 [Xylaria flabelliformis]